MSYRLRRVPNVGQYKMLFLRKLEAQQTIDDIEAIFLNVPQEVVDQAIRELENEGRIERKNIIRVE